MKNVLIIMTDQLRRDVLGCYGGKEVETPYIDSLAEEGILLENCYTPSAVCTPSRGCFMTGIYPHNNGALSNGRPVGAGEHGFAEAFCSAGYRTGYAGKWHLGDHRERGESLEGCNRLGFECWDYQVEFGHCKSVQQKDGRLVLSGQVGDACSYTTDWLADETIRFLKGQRKGSPFLFMVSMPDPHQPFRVRKPYDTMFDPLEMEIPETFYEEKLPDWAEKDEWGRHHYFPAGLFEREDHFRRLKAQYLGAVKCIDDNVGKILHALREENLLEETAVIFTTDHGDYLGEHGLMEKNNLYESVYHIPMLVRLPECKKAGFRSPAWIRMTDFAPTLAGLLGIPYSYPCDGEDLSGELLAGKEGRKEVCIFPSDVPRTGIITEEYELAYVGRGYRGGMFYDHILFDRKRDPLQRENLYGKPEYAGITEVLKEKIKEYHRRYRTPDALLPREVWNYNSSDRAVQ